ALFAHLFASRPARQRRAGPWIVAGLLHIPLLFWFFTSDVGHRLLERAELIIWPVVTVDDNPPPISAPIPVVLAPTAPPAERPVPKTDPEPPIPAPGVPNPAAVPTPSTGGAVNQPGTGVPGSGGSAIDRMGTPLPDPRLFAPTNPERLLTGPDAARARLAESIGAWNDSIAAEQAAAARATDWTVTDKDGKRWGVSPGKLHLGDITLPLPLAFAAPAGRRDELNARNRNFAEIEAQASREGIKDSFNERVKEIRKRKDQERAARTASATEKKKTGSE
ncbi:MAG: hypothetical protein ACREMA_11190, partial [Longimicrobiales bacterium]